MHRFSTLSANVAPATMLALIGLSSSARHAGAEPLRPAFIATNIDWTSAAVGGIGGGRDATGTITLDGVSGTVKRAILYWHGIDNFLPHTERTSVAVRSPAPGSREFSVAASAHTAACDGVYNVPTIFFNGSSVNGVPIGDSETNCWGEGSSRAFRADVTALVPCNGLYTLSRMTADECDDVNGASLVVTFDDGNSANNRDIVFCEGNDSDLLFSFPGETDGWHATLPGIPYSSGPAAIQLHVTDGQNFSGDGLDDDTVTIASDGRSVVIPDVSNRYDGGSVANAGASRSEAAGVQGSLWDVHTFDISAIFTVRGVYTLTLDGQEGIDDCTGLVLAIVDLRAGAANVTAIQATTWGKVKATYR